MAALRSYCCYLPSPVIVPRRTSSTVLIRASMDGCSRSEPKKVPNYTTFTGKVNKVFEDKNMGILCYTDENGELVCEGLDEGPRLSWQDMEKLSKEKMKAEEYQWQRSKPPVAGGIDWSSLQAAVSTGKN